jgi:hypothetical protein
VLRNLARSASVTTFLTAGLLASGPLLSAPTASAVATPQLAPVVRAVTPLTTTPAATTRAAARAAVAPAIVARPSRPSARAILRRPVARPHSLPVGPSGLAMPTASIGHWRLKSAQDFTGSALPTGWGSYEGQPGGEPNGWWKHSHTFVRNGMLTLAGYREGGKYVTGGVMAYGAGVGQQTYGKYEVRFRMAKGHGIKYAALLWPKSERWPIDGEIDFAEDGGGARGRTTGTLHYGASNSQIQKALSGDFSRWNTLGVEWTPGKLVYTLNGRPWATVTGSMVPHTAMNLAIQTQAGTCGSWAGASCPDATTPARVDMQVDWAVAYSYVP